MKKLESCECTELLTSFLNKSNETCKLEKMADWAFSYKDSEVYTTVVDTIADERKNYSKLANTIRDNCPETHIKIVNLMRNLECGC